MIVLKAKFTDKDGKPLATPWRRVQMASGQKVRFFGAEIGFTELQMLALGNCGVDVIKERVSRGVGSDDAPMPVLKSRKARRWSKKQSRWVVYDRESKFSYAQQKKDAGLQSNRDLTFTGDMLSDFSVRSVSATEVRMDITTQESRMKARVNEIRAPWFGWSPADMVKLIGKARELFGHMVQDFGVSIAGRFGQLRRTVTGGWSVVNGGKYTTARPIWMNPWQHAHPGSLDAASMKDLRVRIKSGSVRRRSYKKEA